MAGLEDVNMTSTYAPTTGTGLSVGEITGIVVAITAVISALIALLTFCWTHGMCRQRPGNGYSQTPSQPVDGGTWDFGSCQEQLKKTYKRRNVISKHPTATSYPLHSVDIDDFYSDLALCQNVKKVKKEKAGVETKLDKADTVPLSSWKDLLNAEVVEHLLVIISGGTGHGKSTLLKKIADAWERLNIFSNVKLLFFVELKLMETPSIIDAILEQCFPKDERPKREDLIKIITDNQKETVFLLDGLDELRPDFLKPSTSEEYCINDMLRKKVLVDSRVLVATRPHLVQDIQEGNPKCAHVHVLGFTSQSVDRYIEKHYSDKEKSDALISYLGQADILKHIARIPIFCQMLCIIFDEQPLDRELPDRLTGLYQKFTEVLARRRSGADGDWRSRLTSALVALGRAAFKGLLDGERLELKKEEFNDCASVLDNAKGESGLVQEERFSSGLDETVIVTFLHKSFQEYSAAYYLVNLSHLNQEEFRAKLEQIDSNNVLAMEYLLRFTCGILLTSPSTELVVNHVQNQRSEALGHKDALQRLTRLLLFESRSRELASNLERPTSVDCESHEDLTALHYYSQCVALSLKETSLKITCESHEDLEVLRDILLTAIGNMPQTSLYLDIKVKVKHTLSERGNEEMQHLEETLERMDGALRSPPVSEKRFGKSGGLLKLSLFCNTASCFDELGNLPRVLNQLSDVHVRDRSYTDVERLASALQGCPKLKRMDVSTTNLHGKVRCAASLVHSHLYDFQLKNCSLDDEDVRDLTSIIPAGHSLLSLDVSGNAFTLDGVETLTSHFQALPKLRWFTLLYRGPNSDLVKSVVQRNLPNVICYV